MDNFELMRRRMVTVSDRQHNRMVQDKMKSFHRALLYSYQAAWIKKDSVDASCTDWCRALINPDKIKFDYDEKIVSVDFQEDFHTGDTFEWPRCSNIHWLIYKQELTELAYFRGAVRRCQEVEATDDEGNTGRLFIALYGPTETRIDTIQKAGIVADVPNLSIHGYAPQTEFVRKALARYKKFKLQGRIWMVEACDDISTPGVYEFTAVENYECHGDETLIEKVNPNPLPADDEAFIFGDTFVKPLIKSTYELRGLVAGEWYITLPAEKNKEVEDVLDYTVNADGSITVEWTAMISGSYILHYGDVEKTVVVESLF